MSEDYSPWKSAAQDLLEVQLALDQTGWRYGPEGRVTIDARVLQELLEQYQLTRASQGKLEELDEMKVELEDLDAKFTKLLAAARAVIDRYAKDHPSTMLDSLEKLVEEG